MPGLRLCWCRTAHWEIFQNHGGAAVWVHDFSSDFSGIGLQPKLG